MQDYFFNFWVWWFGTNVRNWFAILIGRVMFVLEYTNTLTMAKNLTTPLFQDDSGIGKMISLFIRIVWVWIGGMISAVTILPMLMIWVVVSLAPVISIGMILVGVFNIF